MVSGTNVILKKCNIYFDDFLISKESILKKYLAFFADSIDPQNRKVGFALHTGSICFDVISVVAVGIGCLLYNLATNDDIIASLLPGDMVMYKGQRYRWRSVERKNNILCISLEQDGTGRNGLSTSWIPYEQNKHLILPYYGDSKTTDGRGVKRKVSNRESFLSYIFDLPVSEIPTRIDVSAVIIAERGVFADICKRVTIEFDNERRIGLLDVIPASYYTSGGIEYRYGSNPTKAEPVLKIAGNTSTARDLVLDKHGNKVVGLLAFGDMISTEGYTELSDLLRRKMLKFALVTCPLRSKLSDHIFELYEGASAFACTKEYLSASNCNIKFANKYTEELFCQVSTIIQNTVQPVIISGGISRDKYINVRNALLTLKQSEWDSDLKDEFIITAQGILNLLNTAVFSMGEMEKAIEDGRINQMVKSPKTRTEYLWSIAEKAGSMQDMCMVVADALEQQYGETISGVPKAEVLREFINEHGDSSIAVVVPKAYYADLLYFSAPDMFLSHNIICVTPNKFDPQAAYDAVVVVGEINNRKFDALHCLSTKHVYVLLYECEEKSFTYRLKQQQRYEYDLNVRLGIASASPALVSSMDEAEELEMQHFSSLDEYVENFNLFDIRNIAVQPGQSSGYIPVSEVTHIGLLTTGEQIFFSKYYSAVIFDAARGTITEKAPSDLNSGDVMVFTKRDDYTKNIVDDIYDHLLTSGRLSNKSVEAYTKSQYWKEALREYKEKNRFTYRDIAKKLWEHGSSLQEVSVRQWLVDDSHIVGPRDKKTLEYVAQITQDPFLLKDTTGYHEACRHVRHERREILKLIAKAINDKFMGFIPPEGSVLEMVYNNVEKLSETRELEEISELGESVSINIGLVNRPITEAEVSM